MTRLAAYSPKGWNIRMPEPAGTIDPDPFNFRSKLADNGFGWFGWTNNSVSYDFHNHGRSPLPQVYNGQKATWYSVNFFYLTYDLSRVGLNGGQLVASTSFIRVNWEPIGPSQRFRVGVLEWYQPLFDGRVELNIGYLSNSFNYTGTNVGGNIAGGTFGVSASIPTQTGMSSTLATRPGVNVKTYLGGGFYNQVGVQRSLDPAGLVTEVTQTNTGAGLGWGGADTGLLYLEEFGLRRNGGPGQRDIWLRAGYTYNTSDFESLSAPGTRAHNYMFTLLGDYQVYQVGDSARGIYAGFSIMHSPASVNRFTDYYEARLYAKGLFSSRPADMISFIVNQNRFSKYAIQDAVLAGRTLTVDKTTTVSLGYTAKVYSGVYVTAGVSYVDHPRPISTIPSQKSAITGSTSLLVYF